MRYKYLKLTRVNLTDNISYAETSGQDDGYISTQENFSITNTSSFPQGSTLITASGEINKDFTTSYKELNTEKELKADITSKIFEPVATIPGYTYVKSVNKSSTNRIHYYTKNGDNNPTDDTEKTYTTKRVLGSSSGGTAGSNIKDPKVGTNPEGEPAGKISGYVYISTEKSTDGLIITHIFESQPVEGLTYRWRDEAGNKLKDDRSWSPDEGGSEPTNEEIPGYTYLRKQEGPEYRTITYIYKKKQITTKFV